MTVFKPEELEKLAKKGNQVSLKGFYFYKVMFEELMSGWSERSNPVPNKNDTSAFKSFISSKYKDKRFSKKAQDSSSEDSDSDNVKKKKKKKKKEEKKKKKKSKKYSDSDEEESEEEEKKPAKKKKVEKKKKDSDSDEESEEEKPKKKMAKPLGSKLRKIGTFEKSEPSRNTEVKKEATAPQAEAPKFESLLEFDSAPQQTAQTPVSNTGNDDWAGAWGSSSPEKAAQKQ